MVVLIPKGIPLLSKILEEWSKLPDNTMLFVMGTSTNFLPLQGFILGPSFGSKPMHCLRHKEDSSPWFLREDDTDLGAKGLEAVEINLFALGTGPIATLGSLKTGFLNKPLAVQRSAISYYGEVDLISENGFYEEKLSWNFNNRSFVKDENGFTVLVLF